jgi:hypothetical protein
MNATGFCYRSYVRTWITELYNDYIIPSASVNIFFRLKHEKQRMHAEMFVVTGAERCVTSDNFYLWVLYPVAYLSNWFLMISSIATKFQYVTPRFLFSFTHYMFRPLQVRYTIRCF